MACEAAAVAWVLASSESKGSEVKEGWRVWDRRMERVDFVLLRRSFALRDDEGSILGNVCEVWEG